MVKINIIRNFNTTRVSTSDTWKPTITYFNNQNVFSYIYLDGCHIEIYNNIVKSVMLSDWLSSLINEQFIRPCYTHKNYMKYLTERMICRTIW
jgi:hypothetical protein